jgi:hypothetical protein
VRVVHASSETVLTKPGEVANGQGLHASPTSPAPHSITYRTHFCNVAI